MVQTINFLTNWIVLSSLYLLVALGFTLVFGVAGDLNLAHGLSIVIGGVSVYVTVSVWGLNVWVGLVVAIVAAGVLNWVLYMFLVRRIEDNPIAIAILTLAVFLFMEHFIFNIIGSASKTIPPLIAGRTPLLGNSIANNRIAIVVLSLSVVGILTYFINNTKQGKAINAVSMSTKGANLVGIDTKRVYLSTWVIAGILAAISGVFLASTSTINPDMGLRPMIISFIIVILGGLGSIRGSVVAAYLIGFIEVGTTLWLDSGLALLTPLLVMLLIVLVKPEGLFGRGEVDH